jgi:hypothetical protein
MKTAATLAAATVAIALAFPTAASADRKFFNVTVGGPGYAVSVGSAGVGVLAGAPFYPAFAPVVTPSECSQDPVVEGLHPDAHPVETGALQPSHEIRVDVPRVDLDGDLGARGDREALADPMQELRKLPYVEARGRSASHVNRVEDRGEIPGHLLFA